MSDDITVWLDRLVQGDPSAAEGLWKTYWTSLVTVARQKLRDSRRRVADEEDVVRPRSTASAKEPWLVVFPI